MALTLERIEALAPDQASLGAAKKLLKASNWPTLASGEGLLWGECQGSGSTPYRVAVQEEDAGYKCTCPSRKFPCKHSLALMWMRVDGSVTFPPAPVPDWVKDWLARRRGPSAAASGADAGGAEAPKARASISLAADAETEKASDPKAEKRAAEARERNKQAREEAVLAGLEELDIWLRDQVRAGMLHFVNQAAQSCRTITQRLVDAKAGGLASRLDSLVARLYTLPTPARPQAAIRELGQIYLISQAYRRGADLSGDDGVAALLADVRQAVGWPVTREALLQDPETLRVRGSWRVFAVRSEVQADRLRRVETWLSLEGGTANASLYAVLIDFTPVSMGAAAGGYLPGDRIEAELGFYKSSLPMRAQIISTLGGATGSTESIAMPRLRLRESYARYEEALAKLPWLGTMPLSFQSARVRRSGERLYLHDSEGAFSLPLPASQSVQALPLAALESIDGIGLWDGYEFVLTWAETDWGLWRP